MLDTKVKRSERPASNASLLSELDKEIKRPDRPDSKASLIPERASTASATKTRKLRRREVDLPLKEAMIRANERIIAAKQIILRNLALMLNRSNGMEIDS